jgi:urease accessory protein
VLSAAVIGWESTPIAGYLVGLLISQGLLLLLSLSVVRAWASQAQPAQLRLLAGLLMGVGGAFAWTNLVP